MEVGDRRGFAAGSRTSARAYLQKLLNETRRWIRPAYITDIETSVGI